MKERDRGSLEHWVTKLILAAEAARENAYAPYSKYMVGAAVSDKMGVVHGGCNVENAAYTGTHAEAGAIAKLVSSGHKEISQIACATKDGGSPCGDCRQRIWELSNGNKDLEVFLIDENGKVMETSIGELLPFAFELS